MPLLRDQLQATLGSGFTLERELGGGGMSRVFVAQEHGLSRRVVVKVLPPDMLEGVSVERFRREIQLAAGLQHPHIVPVHSAGETNGLPFYTMPFVDGASLRERLADGVPLGIGEATEILREVAKALAYAHGHGVVHRDIKPENVLLTGGTAVVTDFGIAKALSASRGGGGGGTGGGKLTSVGMSIGTPAYMAPEQAAADPNIDHRADIYAFGCLAYEMLAGTPPFSAVLAHQVLVAHMRDVPQPLRERRAEVSPALEALVMRCLEKDPTGRPQSADEIVRELGKGSASGETLVGTRVAEGDRFERAASIQPVSAGRVLAIFGASALAVMLIANGADAVIGLPTWVIPGAAALMGIAFVIVLVTLFVHRGAHRAHTAEYSVSGNPPAQPTLTRMAVRASPFMSWRRTTKLGAAVLGAFVLLVAGYGASRALGIGPAASLSAQGVVDADDRIMVAEFTSLSDSTLGPAVTEAFRSDVSQSDAITVVQPNQTRAVLGRMQLPPNTRVDYALAQQIARREGIKGVIDGTVNKVGSNYVLTATFYEAASGDSKATFRATAKSSDDIIDAIGELSRDVRAKLGESLRTVNAAPPLEQVTTPSLEALRKYATAVRIFNEAGDFDRGIKLLEEAVALDTGFAMAYRKLSVELRNQNISPARAMAAIEKAYAHRDRLTDTERYLTEGAYFTNGPKPDRRKSIEAYEALVELNPRATVGYNNAASSLRYYREYARAESLSVRGLALDSVNGTLYQNVLFSQMGRGDLDAADRTLARLARNLPQSPNILFNRAQIAWNRRRYDSTGHYLDMVRRKFPADDGLQAQASFMQASVALVHGRVTDAQQQFRESTRANVAIGNTAAVLQQAGSEAFIEAFLFENPKAAVRILDAALKATPLASMPAVDRPYFALVAGYAIAGDTRRAKELFADFEASRRNMTQANDEYDRPSMLGEIALAEGRYADAVRLTRESDIGFCPTCPLPSLSRAYDLSGNVDSAIAVFKRYTSMVDSDRYFVDAFFLAGAHKRLGELLEAKGDRAGAATEYATFLELWKDADPRLQPRVREVRASLARLQATERR
ncbi:MAG: protein kinase [Gemmatimonadota bacterium]